MSAAFFDDTELVRLAQEGKLEAFNTLYERYLPVVFNRVRYTVPEADVEDVTQEIFIAVIRSLHSFRGDSQFNTWLRTLTNRQVADYYRRKRPAHNSVEAIESDDEMGHTRTELIERPTDVEEAITLRHALVNLPDSYREIILMRFADGLKFNEIAEMSGRSLEATKSLFRRAVTELRKQVELSHG